mgnify:CR=1 FL=1
MTMHSSHDFLRTASQTLHNLHGGSRKSALLVVDFERLAELDGILGYSAVDEILQLVAERFCEALNSEDIVGATGRYQLGCLLVDLLTNNHAILAAHKILRILAQPFTRNNRRIILSPCIGVASNTHNSSDLGQLMSNASFALHQARISRESIKLFVEEEEPLLSGVDLWSDLGRAIETSELHMVYQPQFNINSGRIKSTEALLRWNHPHSGPIRPDKLVQVAEGTELMSRLTLWVFTTALRQCAEYRKAGLDAGVSINLSADDLRDPELTELFEQGLNLWGVPPSDVMIELTETAVMGNNPASLQTIHELKDIGMKLAMDDFGTGYSSMERLLLLPLDEVKVDMAFVKGMATSQTHERIVRSMIGLGHLLNLQVIAEGVEDLATYKQLKRLGCDTIQGYLIGKGMPLPELIETLTKQPHDMLFLSDS